MPLFHILSEGRNIMERVVGLGEIVVSGSEEDIIKTFALASCIAVTAYSPSNKVAGMIHIVLPHPFDSKDYEERPGYFAESGIPLLFRKMCGYYGCRKEELQVQMYGGADSICRRDIYRVGLKNINAARQKLIGLGIAVYRADLGGTESRTIAMEVGTGRIEVFRRPMIL